jgi:hypothetical protein
MKFKHVVEQIGSDLDAFALWSAEEVGEAAIRTTQADRWDESSLEYRAYSTPQDALRNVIALGEVGDDGTTVGMIFVLVPVAGGSGGWTIRKWTAR